MLSLANRFLQFFFNPTTGYWNLQPAAGAAPCLESARLGAIYDVLDGRQRRTVYWDGELVETQAAALAAVDSRHGRLRCLQVQARTGPAPGDPLAVNITFALPEEGPYLLWRLEVRNAGTQPVALNVLDLLRVGPRFQPRSGRSGLGFRLRSLFRTEYAEVEHPAGPAGSLRLGPPSHGQPSASGLSFYSNGYQSWSFAGALQADMHQPSSFFGPLGDPKALNLVSPRFRRPGRFTSDMFGVMADRPAGLAVVAGFLAQHEQFSAVEVLLHATTPSLRLTAQCDGVELKPGEARCTDWAFLQFAVLDEPDPLGEYVRAVARENEARVPAHTPVGWCSWYHYFDRVTEADMLANLEAIGAARPRLPLDLVQLDDGFQAQVGDWFETKPTFPHGLRWLAGRIRESGQVPGLWLAPYMVRSDARILREHPDWFLREPHGRLANAGLNWARWCYALDPTHPEVRAHVRRLIATAVHEWGFPYLKLDFMYAAALPAQRYDASLTRAQAMRQALVDIREAAGPEAFLLGCGCPLGPAVGVVDGMRVSTDVAPDWDPQLFTPRLAPLLHREMDFVGVRNAIRNTINRAPLHRRWWLNDPDCLLVRDHDTHLTEAEVRSLASVIALSGGMFVVSDDMNRLSPERHRYVAALLPVLGKTAHAPGWLDSLMPDLFLLPLSGPHGQWTVAGVFNWEREPRDRTVALEQLGLEPADQYYVSEFWDQEGAVVRAGEPLVLRAIPAHGVRLVAVRPFRPGQPGLVSSSLHFSQGAEVTAWQASGGELCATVELGRQAEGELGLVLPRAPQAAQVDGRAVRVQAAGQGVYRLSVSVNHTATLLVQW